MICSLEEEVDRLLARLPGEIQLDLADAALRFKNESTLRDKVSRILESHAHRERILQELFGTGPLEPLLMDESVTEIIINGHDSIWFERRGTFFEWEDHFISPFTLSQFVQLICLEARLRLDLNQPFADGMWRGLRVHLAQSPLVNYGHSICLRRHPRFPWTLERLLENGWASAEQIELLRFVLRERWNMMIIGPTGTGKTSVLSALLNELPHEERVVIIEDTSEIHIPNSASTKLLTRVDTQGILKDFEQTELVRQSLRMRPSRLVVGEVRGGEAKDLLLALSTGHSGSLGSLHAFSARQALLRLEMLVQMGAPDWSLHTVRNLILLALNALVVVKMENGMRRLEGVYKICSLEDCGFLLEELSSPPLESER